MASRSGSSDGPSLPQLTFEGSPIDASRLTSPFDGTELHPTNSGSQLSAPIDPNRLNSLQSADVSSPISPVTTSSVDVENGTAHTEDLITPGPVRTLELQRQSVLGGPPQYRLAEVDRRPSDPRLSMPSREDSYIATEVTSRSQRAVSNLWVWIVLAITTLFIIGGYGFLAYLWAARDSTWRQIVTSNWAVRATTITATVIWIAVELQTVITGLALWFNRQAGTGMRSRRNKEYASIHTTTKTARTSQGLINFGFIFLLLTFALHFISTILLTDFENGLFADAESRASPFGYGLSDVRQANISKSEEDFSGINPPQFASFAEYAEPLESLQPAIADMGETIRALLPFASADERTSLANYKGMSTLLNSRVVCVAPDLENVTYTSTGPSTSPASPAQQITGTIALRSTVPNGLQVASGASTSLSISCGLQLAQVEGESPISMCAIGNDAITVATPFADAVGALTSTYLLLNHTANSTIPVSAEAGTGNFQNVSITSWDTETVGVWTNATYAPNPIFSIQLTLCFVSAGSVEASIEATGARGRTEPSFQAVQGQSIHTANDTAVLNQLGVNTNATTEERGLMSLSQKQDWVILTTPSSVIDSSKIFGEMNVTYGLCMHCGSYRNDGTAIGVASGLSICFQHALELTGSPAKALQAIFTTARASQYYSRLPYFDLSDPAIISRYVEAYHPHHYSSLIALGALLLLHLALVALITIMTLRHSQISLIDRVRNAFTYTPISSRIHSRSNSMENPTGMTHVVGGPTGPQILDHHPDAVLRNLPSRG